MASKETAIVNTIMKDVSPFGVRLFRNVRGMFYTKDGRPIRAGLMADGSGDLIGFMPVVITQAMVGQKIAVFSAVECKTETGRPSPEQLHFCDFIRKSGGLAGIARSPEDARKILEIPY